MINTIIFIMIAPPFCGVIFIRVDIDFKELAIISVQRPILTDVQ